MVTHHTRLQTSFLDLQSIFGALDARPSGSCRYSPGSTAPFTFPARASALHRRFGPSHSHTDFWCLTPHRSRSGKISRSTPITRLIRTTFHVLRYHLCVTCTTWDHCTIFTAGCTSFLPRRDTLGSVGFYSFTCTCLVPFWDPCTCCCRLHYTTTAVSLCYRAFPLFHHFSSALHALPVAHCTPALSASAPAPHTTLCTPLRMPCHSACDPAVSAGVVRMISPHRISYVLHCLTGMSL